MIQSVIIPWHWNLNRRSQHLPTNIENYNRLMALETQNLELSFTRKQCGVFIQVKRGPMLLTTSTTDKTKDKTKDKTRYKT